LSALLPFVAGAANDWIEPILPFFCNAAKGGFFRTATRNLKTV
jgi:hypothetical protein